MIGWDEAYRLAKILARKIIRSGFKPDLVIGIARGGLVPACALCDLLLRKDLASIKVEHWGMASTLGKAKIKFHLPMDISGKKILIVDDVADTGDTCSLVMDYLKEKNPAEVRTAALHYKTSSTFIPDYWGEKQEEWRWIIYPWSRYEDLTGFIEKVLTKAMRQEDIRDSLNSNYEIKISKKDLVEILKHMLSSGKIKTIKRDKKVLWLPNIK